MEKCQLPNFLFLISFKKDNWAFFFLQYRSAPAVPANLHQRRLLVRKGHLSFLVEADVLEVFDEPGFGVNE